MKLNELKEKSILILGFGKEGRDSFRFLRRLFPGKAIGVGDEQEKIKNLIKKDKNVKWYLGKDYLKAIKNYDIIIKSPGIPIHLPEIERAYKQGKITSQTEIFFENCPGKIIGITGTKGKGTTALLIYKILKQGGIKARLVGNIGKPALSALFSAKPKDVYVYELSSHQLYNLKKSPQIAVFLNIYPDHLDYYRNFKEYTEAKSNICRYQGKNDYLIYNPKNKIIRKIVKKSKAGKTPIPTIGRLNLLSIDMASAVGRILGVSNKDIKKAIKDFKLLPHRLEYLGIYQGIKFYNDSASTIPEATIFALDRLGKRVQTILLGGSEKKVSFKKLAKRILKSDVKNLIFFPTTGKKIWQTISPKKYFRVFFVNSMKEAVKLAYQHTQKGKICLLSPASASFGLFKDYKERGNLFKKYLKIYGKKS